YHLKQILLQEEPTISIGQLPVLMSDIKEIIQQETEEQKNAVLIHANKLIEQLNELAEYYHQYDSIVKYIKEAAGDAVQLQGRIEESQRITSARINQHQLSELVDSIKTTSRNMLNELMQETDIVKREAKRLDKNELYHMFFSQVESIETEEELERAINLLKDKLLRELQTHYLIK